VQPSLRLQLAVQPFYDLLEPSDLLAKFRVSFVSRIDRWRRLLAHFGLSGYPAIVTHF
jgi:hypothetical protein